VRGALPAQETELRTLKAAAEDVAAKFDAAVAVLAAKRLDVLAEVCGAPGEVLRGRQSRLLPGLPLPNPNTHPPHGLPCMQVTALEGRMLRLLADEEVASVTAGLELQQQAAARAEAAQAALDAVEEVSTMCRAICGGLRQASRGALAHPVPTPISMLAPCVPQELACTQQLLLQQQEALSALHAEEKAADSTFKRQFGHMDAAPHLAALYKARLALAHGSSPPEAPAASPSHLQARPGMGRAGGNGRSSAVGAAVSPRPPSSHAVSARAAAGKAAAAASSAADATAAGAGSEVSAVLVFAAQQLQGPHAPAKGKAPTASAAAAAAKREDGSLSHHPLGPAEMVAVQLQGDSQRPEGLDEGLWLHFTELHAARTQLELASWQQAAQVACLRRALQLLQAKQSQAAASACAAEAALAELQARQADAMQDVEVQLSLKQGQVECWPHGLAAIAPEALLVARQQVKALNGIILAKVGVESWGWRLRGVSAVPASMGLVTLLAPGPAQSHPVTGLLSG
jgi:hypothetical protein